MTKKEHDAETKRRAFWRVAARKLSGKKLEVSARLESERRKEWREKHREK